jgi:hypothetical protein
MKIGPLWPFALNEPRQLGNKRKIYSELSESEKGMHFKLALLLNIHFVEEFVFHPIHRPHLQNLHL